MLRVLIVDDQDHVLDAMELLFEMRGKLAVQRASTPAEAESVVRSGGVGVVVQDMNFSEGTTSGDEGVRLFERLRALDPDLPIILMTAWATVDRAVELVKRGADDYLQKPWDDAALLKRVQRLMRTREEQAHLDGAATGPSASSDAQAGPVRFPGTELCGLLFQSAAMCSVVSLAVKVARTDLPALITGPNGAGKEKIAEIVRANSPRRDGPFVKVNVGALPDELFSAELFGAEAGAFTGAKTRRIGRFEAAHEGTLFLDEIGNLSMDSQAKLLRAVQSGEFERLGSNQTRRADVRVVAATNVDMTQAIAEQRFREDLYYRLAVIELEVPPLRERGEDVPLLARAFAPGASFSDECLKALCSYGWPGNVRELQNRVQRALLLSEGEPLEIEHFGIGDAQLSDIPAASDRQQRPPNLERAEREAIEQALEQSDYVISHAAAALGLTRQALYRRMQRVGIKVRRDVSS